ncbi:MAG TPA: hypothetical protein VGE84_01510, partial [Allosphingosinicella sp.]
MRPGRRIRAAIFGLFAMLGAGAGGAQLLPRGVPVDDVLGSVGRVGVDAIDSASRAIDTLGAHVRTLTDARIG